MEFITINNRKYYETKRHTYYRLIKQIDINVWEAKTRFFETKHIITIEDPNFITLLSNISEKEARSFYFKAHINTLMNDKNKMTVDKHYVKQITEIGFFDGAVNSSTASKVKSLNNDSNNVQIIKPSLSFA